VEKQELELFIKGQFVITDDEAKEDASAGPVPPEEKKVRILFGRNIFSSKNLL